MNNQKSSLKKRQIGLDIYRLVATLIVFLFHANIHLACTFGVFTSFISMGAIFMTAFFMLSGYVLFLTYQKIDLAEINNIKYFYLKRGLGVLPLYYVTSILFIIFLGSETIKQNILLAPIEILGLQSVFTSVFSITHNGGTWFISCIILCYLLYPYIQQIVKQISIKSKIILGILSIIVILWAPLIEYYFNTGPIYANPFFRILEFFIGILLASLKEKIEINPKSKFLMSGKAILLESTILILSVTLAVKSNIFIGNYMMYNWIALPMFITLLISTSAIPERKKMDDELIKFLCKRTHAFWLAQFFTWSTTRSILNFINLDDNWARIVVAVFVNVVYTFILHDVVEKLLLRGLRKL